MLALSDRLAVSRTALANERTLLAYVRTALALAAGGFALVELVRSPKLDVLGYAMIAGGGLLLMVGLWRYWRARLQLESIGRAMAGEGSNPSVPPR